MSPTEETDDDPILKSYNIHLTDSEVTRYVLQYIDRDPQDAYDDAHGNQRPVCLRQKPSTGLMEIDVPIATDVSYDLGKGVRFGDAMRRSRLAAGGSGRGGYGMAGGFASGSGGGGGGGGGVKVKAEAGGEVVEEVQEIGGKISEAAAAGMLRVQTLGGRVKSPEEGDPVYMLGTFRDDNVYLSPVSAVVQLRPQLHHLDALNELPRARGGKGRKEDEERSAPESEARAVDVKIKTAAQEDSEAALVAGNLDLLKKMQEEKWTTYGWVDAEMQEAWDMYEDCMIQHDAENLPDLQSAISSEDYLDKMSAPRIDPARPEMTGWAMKQNRKKHTNTEDAAVE